MLVSQAYYSGYTDWHWFWKGVGKLSWRQRPYLQGTMPSVHRWIVSELHWIRGYSACLLVERSHHIFWGHRCFLGRLLCRESKKKQDVNKCEVALGQLLPSQSRAAPGHPSAPEPEPFLCASCAPRRCSGSLYWVPSPVPWSLKKELFPRGSSLLVFPVSLCA